MGKNNYTSAFNYFGGKNSPRLLAWLLSKVAIVEPFHLAGVFGGSGAVELNYRKAKLRTFNDLNSDIFNFFNIARSQGDELIRRLELTLHSREEYDANYMSDVDDPIEKARVFFIRCNQSFGNSGALKVYNSWSYTIRDSRYGCSQSTARFLSKVAGLHKVVQELRTIQIEHLDFRKFIKKYDSEKTVFYVDPPYVPDTRSYHQRYVHELSIDDHVELSEILKCIKGKFLLSGYHSELYDGLYKGFSCDSIGNIRTNAKGGGMDKATEVVWANYDLHQNKLFDHAEQREAV
jgi:DNA adenine methylase